MSQVFGFHEAKTLKINSKIVAPVLANNCQFST
jgi:hypothetical protein